jgi:hypothetical protein
MILCGRVSLAVLTLSLCLVGQLKAQSAESSNAVVAKVGDIYISEEEFLERYELLPAPGRSRKGSKEEAKLELLYSMIAEKLLAQEAVSRHLEKDSQFVAVFDDLRRKLARDYLYGLEIEQKVVVTKQEIAQALKRTKRKLVVAYIYCDRRADADFIRGQIRKASDFDKLVIDSSMHAVRDTVEVRWGEAEEPLENAAYLLSGMNVSPVTEAGNGFYIARLLKSEVDTHYSSMDPGELRKHVEEKLRLRGERKRLDEYVSVALKNRVGYALPRTFKALAIAFEDALRASGSDYPIAVTETMFQRLKKTLSGVLNDTLIVADNRMWSVQEVLSKLYETGFSFDSLETTRVPDHLNLQLKQWVQQEILGDEALAQGLDKVASVSKQLHMWYDYFLSVMMEDRVKAGIRLKESDVLSYLKHRDPGIALPKVKVRELRFETLDDLQEAMGNLRQGMSFEEVRSKWMRSSPSDPNQADSKFFSIVDRPPIGELAWKTDVGKFFGPVKNEEGYSLFQVVAKEDTQVVRNEKFIAEMDSAGKELLKMKDRREVNKFIAKAGEERSFDVYADRLKMLKVTSIPMMTYRILGFGGRIVAVPFVRRRLDWLNIEQSKGNTIP